MRSPLSFNLVPDAYVSAVSNRINVEELPKEKIREVIKTADVYEKEVILQDLLLAGRKMETKEQRNMVSLAAELFIHEPVDIQRDFLMHIIGAKLISKNFHAALVANSISHELMESTAKGSSGLSIYQLEIEKVLMISLEKYIK